MTDERTRTGRVPLATYRMQVHREFGFDAVREQLPYLAALGISHLYLSPILQAVPGSTHGYDVIDPTSINTELGGEAAFVRMVEELRRLGLGLIVDIVPNHMGIADGANPWWEDVLRAGRDSPHAAVFDIDWDVPDPDLHGRVLLPILGDRLDTVLGRGELTIEGGDDGPLMRYGDRLLPLAPGTFEAVGGTSAHLDRDDPRRTSPDGIATLRRLLDEQHYRLDFWRDGKSRINYRRFFEIDTLIGVRQEDPAVFERTHALTLRLVRDGLINGLRIDHIDGLADPAVYLRRLREATGGSPETPAIYVVVEKILGPGEALPESWATDGTTGYDFLTQLNGVFVAREQEDRIVDIYRRFTGHDEAYSELAYAARRAIEDGPLAGRFAVTIARLHRAARDILTGIPLATFDEAVHAIVASLPVYRTYHSVDTLDAAAPRVLDAAAAAAFTADPALDREALEATRALLAAPPPGEVRTVVMVLQQLMPAVAAKGVEDSVFYRYVPLVSLNTVGGDPDRFGTSVAGFHEANAARRRSWPAAMTTIATHDHKRGADARARIDALSDLPDDWEATLERWSAMNHPGDVDHGIDRRDEHLLYQTLLGSWPPGATATGINSTFVDRVQAYMLKSVREGGEQSHWIDPDLAYERSLANFVAQILDIATSRPFLDDLARFAGRVARAGAVNSLAMVVLQIAAPGVPDIYQGGARWDLSLVDPDNRRPVGYGVRTALLNDLDDLNDTDSGDGADAKARDPQAGTAVDLLDHWESGAVKQYVLARLLERRRTLAPLFLDGTYEAIPALGPQATHVIAYARQHQGRAVIAVVPRLPSPLMPESADGPLWAPDWGDTVIRLPDGLPDGPYRDAITGTQVGTTTQQGARTIDLASILGRFPVAFLESVEASTE